MGKARGSPWAFADAIRVQTHLLHTQVSLGSIGLWLQGGIAGGSVRKCSWPSQRLLGVPRAAAAGGQGCPVWGQRRWVARLRLWLQGGCSNAARSSTAIDVALGTTSEDTAAWQLFHLRLFCTWNSQNFSWCWTKNTLFPWNSSPSLRSVYPTAAMVKNPEESITWRLGACGRWTLQPENILHFSNLSKIHPGNLMEEYGPKKWSQVNICEMKD